VRKPPTYKTLTSSTGDRLCQACRAPLALSSAPLGSSSRFDNQSIEVLFSRTIASAGDLAFGPRKVSLVRTLPILATDFPESRIYQLTRNQSRSCVSTETGVLRCPQSSENSRCSAPVRSIGRKSSHRFRCVSLFAKIAKSRRMEP
jgi:hypothetical protein